MEPGELADIIRKALARERDDAGSAYDLLSKIVDELDLIEAEIETNLPSMEDINRLGQD